VIAYNISAEISVIGGLLIDEDVLPQVIDILKPEEFYVPLYAEFYRYILEMSGKGKKIDFVTMVETMKSKVDLPEEKLKAELLMCADSVPTAINSKAYAEIIAKNARARKIQLVIGGANDAPLTAENVDEVSEQIMNGLYNNLQGGKQGLQPIKAPALEYYTNLFKKRTQSRIDTGYGDLDLILKGMWSGNLVLLAARPGIGKTAFALQIAQNVARKGKTVNFYSLEMEKDELIERIVSADSGVSMDSLIDNDNLADKADDTAAIAQSIDKLYGSMLNISDDAGITPTKIRAQSRMTKNLGLIVVDYLQLLTSSKKCENRNQEIGSISRELKLIANDLKVPILALSQLSREIEHRSSPKPVMADLRDSGSLEQDANKIMFMWEIDPESHIVAVDVAKNRRGSRGQAQFKFDGSHMKYSQLFPTNYVTETKGVGKIPYDNEFKSKRH
jgi:replicative DNA helicase